MGFYPDPNVVLAVGGAVISPAFPLVIDGPTYDLIRNATLYFDGNSSTSITNNTTAWREGDTLAIINDGTEVATVTFISAAPVLGPFVTPDLYPGEAVILKIASGQWVEVARKATPDKFIVESLASVTTSNDIDASPVVKFEQILTLKGGEYLLGLHFEAGNSSSARALAAQLYLDGVAFQGRFSHSNSDRRDRTWPNKHARTAFIAEGDHTFRLDFGRDYGGGGSTVTMQNATLTVESIR